MEVQMEVKIEVDGDNGGHFRVPCILILVTNGLYMNGVIRCITITRTQFYYSNTIYYTNTVYISTPTNFVIQHSIDRTS